MRVTIGKKLYSETIEKEKETAKISFFIKAGFITLLLTAIFLLATVFQTKDLSNKYEQAMIALKSEDWDKAIQLFSEIENKSEDVIREYKDTSKRLCEAKYEKAKDLLVSAMDNYSKNNFSASVDSTEKAIALLDYQSLNISATLLFQAKELLKRPDNKNIIDKRIVDKRIAENNKRIAENNERHGKDSTLAYLIAQDFIKKTLKSPSTAVFPGKWHEGVYVGHIGNYTYAIRAYVDSQNSFGATLRTYYYAEVRYDGDADSWFLEDISFN
ncbi:hypothetical protein [Candidatus Kuenenia sp.]|uniref:hypothetical protein n=1 Tax=Candidatus Kuenenia sp. TaxID=2499824 RepID=UPI0032204025